MHLHWRRIPELLCIALLAAACSSCNKKDPPATAHLTPLELSYPSYLPKMLIPADNPLTVEGAALGRKLYYDSILSRSGLSCSSCHLQSESFSKESVNSLPHVNAAWQKYFLWNGKISGTLEDAMRFEVEEFFNTDLAKLNANAAYRRDFKNIFGTEQIRTEHVAKALAQFFRTMVSANSRFDQFVQHKINLTASELNGFDIFMTEKGDCFHCHSAGLFTDGVFHNIGLDTVFSASNEGRYGYTGMDYDKGAFKTPSLRNVALTPPYMHDGRFKTLEEVVEHYNSGVKFGTYTDPLMMISSKIGGLKLTTKEKTDLVNFLKTLTDTEYISNPALSKP